MRHRGTAAWVLTSGAILLSLLLLVGAFVVPVYSGDPAGDETLVGVNGRGVLLPLSVPLLLSVVAWAGLRRKCEYGSRRGERFAFCSLVLLFLYAVITGFSIGLAVTPIALLVALGFTLTPTGPRQQL
jgi:hypothetical protein